MQSTNLNQTGLSSLSVIWIGSFKHTVWPTHYTAEKWLGLGGNALGISGFERLQENWDHAIEEVAILACMYDFNLVTDFCNHQSHDKNQSSRSS